MPRSPTRPATDAVLTMAPPPAASIAGISYFIDRKTPLRLTSMRRSQATSSSSATANPLAPTPALLKATCSRPNAASARSTMPRQSASRLTSAATASASPPSPSIIATVALASASFRSTTTTRPPSLAKSWAVARPIPEPAPVTRMLRSTKRPVMPPPLHSSGEIGAMQDVGILPQRVGLAGKADAATLHDIGVVRYAQRDMRELLDQQNADALGGERLQHRHQPRYDHRR